MGGGNRRGKKPSGHDWTARELVLLAIKDPNELGPEIRDRIAWARVHKGYGCNQLDKMAGLSQGYTSRLENGLRTESAGRRLNAIAAVLGVRVKWILDGSAPVYEKSVLPSKPNLEHTLRNLNKGFARWDQGVVALARALIDGDRSLSRWPDALDVLDALWQKVRVMS